MTHKPSNLERYTLWPLILLGLGTVIGLVVVSRYNYLLFHTLAEGFSIAVATAIFTLAWNTWAMTDHGYLKVLGVASLFIGILDLVHTLAYQGMGVFPGYDANLPTQLWIAARYMQALTLLVAPSFLNSMMDETDRYRLAGVYAALTAILLAMIFTGVFPDFYIEGQGLTPIKIANEYAIGLLLAGSIWRILRHRNAFRPDIFRWLVAAIGLTIISELAFTFYVSVYGLSNLIGHLFKLFAFYGIYHAIIETGLRQPYALIFREMQEQNVQLTQEIIQRTEAEEALRQTTERLRTLHRIDTAILRAQSPREITIAALERLHTLIPCDYASIAEIDPAKQESRDKLILVEGELRPEAPEVRSFSDLGSTMMNALQQGRSYTVQDTATREALSPLERMLKANGIRSYVVVPLWMQEAPIGTLNLASDRPNAFRPTHIEILEEIATSLTVAMQQAHLLAQTQRDAETKDLLLREVNHRVRNNLDAIIGLLYVERRHAPPEAQPIYRPMMENLTQRITGLAQVHEMLSQAEWAPLNLGELAEQIIHTTLRGTRNQIAAHCEVAPTSVQVSPAQAQHLALIISELTTNTLKYAANDRETIHITVRIAQTEDDTITLTYRNDGPPYPEDVLSLKRHSAGMDIVKRSVRTNLRGDLTLSNEEGAVTEIRFQREE
jgi:two-component sensor histidine kinase